VHPLIAVVFDWDGTLSNSMPGVLEAFGNFSMEHFGIDPNKAKETMLKHLGEKLSAHLLRITALANQELSDRELDGLVRKCDTLGIKKIMAACLFPEVRDVLSELKDRGYELCVSSGMIQDQLLRVVKSKGIDNYFKFILGTRENFHKGVAHFNFISEELSTKPKQMVFVGDGPYDMKVGRNYGCFTVGRVDQIDAETLLSAGANAIINDLQQLPKAIKENVKVD